MTTVEREFPTGVVLSVVTGMLACKFSDMHECIEHMAGGPVWTHQLPSWLKATREKLIEAFPDLAAYDTTGLNNETANAWMAERAEFLAAPRKVPVFGGQPASPFEGLEGKDVIVAQVE